MCTNSAPDATAGWIEAAALLSRIAGPGAGRRAPAARWPQPRALPGEGGARHAYVAGLIGACAMECASVQILSCQIDLFGSLPEPQHMLRQHVLETEVQYERLILLLDGMGIASPDGEGDPMPCEPPWDADPRELLEFAALACGFKESEAAFYRALMPLARLAGRPDAVELLSRSLAEEERMAAWGRANLDHLARVFAGAKPAGTSAHADHTTTGAQA